MPSYEDADGMTGERTIWTTYNPTAENMAHAMFNWISKQIPQCFKVRLHETDTGYAEYTED